MLTSNLPINQNKNLNNSLNTDEEQDKTRKRNALQRNIIMLESDLRKKTVQKELVFSELRRLKKEESQIRMNSQLKQEEMKKLEDDIRMMEMEISSTKKKINLL
jgi:chromosome segregation ATPase